MMQFHWWWVTLLIPLPILLRYLIKPAAQSQAALKVPHLSDFELQLRGKALHGKTPSVNLFLASLIWLSALAAAAQPEWLGESISIPISGRDLMLAVDLSGSMETDDFELSNRRVDRLTATKAVAGNFIANRVGDRLGLIVFGRNAYLQSPLTFDRETVRKLLYETVIGLAGDETAIGDAIGLAVKRLRLKSNKLSDKNQSTSDNTLQRISNDRVLILLTDGENTAGEVDPIKAAQLAASFGLKIYTIGIGADEILVPTIFGAKPYNPSRDLDENSLKKIAKITGGKFFRAKDTGELMQIYQLIDALEPVKRDDVKYRPRHSLYMWPLSLALLLSVLLAIRLMRS